MSSEFKQFDLEAPKEVYVTEEVVLAMISNTLRQISEETQKSGGEVNWQVIADEIISKVLTLSVKDGTGDAKIQAGKTDFNNTENGFILGIDDSDANKVKFYLGNDTNYINWDGTTLTIVGGIDISSKLDKVGGAYQSAASGARVLIFPDANTGFQVIDDGGADVFKIIVGGTDVGDVIIGNYAGGQGLKYDKSAGTISYKNVGWSDITGAGKAADNATVGANWNTNLSNIPAAVTNISTITADIVPLGLTASATGISTAPDGTQSAYITLTWTAITSDTFDHYQIRYKKAGLTYYIYVDSKTNTITIDGLVPNTSYNFGIASVNKYGTASAFSTDIASTSASTTSAPATVANVAATGGIQYSLLTWDSNTEADLASYNIYRNTTNNSGTATLIGNCRTNYFVDGNRVGGTTYYYWIKAVNTSGLLSAAFSTVASCAPRNVTSDDIVTIAGSKVLIDGVVYLSNWQKGGDLTKIDGGMISAATITTTQLNFTPVTGANVIATINASAEGIKIDADILTINAATTFGAGYDPTGKVAAAGGSYDSAASGARVRIFPDANTGIQIIDDAANDVFKALVGGTDVGDVIIGGASKYVKWDKSAASLIIVADDVTLNGSSLNFQDTFGNGSDGDVTISADTTLTSDMYYNNLTINTGKILYTNGFRVFVKGILNCVGTGKFVCTGNNGGTGGNGVNADSGGAEGVGGAAIYSTGTLPIPLAGSNGGKGLSKYATAPVGTVGHNGIAAAKALGAAGTNGGRGGDGSGAGAGSGLAGGTGGAKTGTILDYPKTYTTAINLFDKNGTAIAQHTISAGSGGGGGGGQSNDYSGGGGGGAGSPGGFIWVAAKNITNINAEAKGGNGGQGGNSQSGGTGGGVGGGGAGGSGGVIILIYSLLTASSLSVSGGTKGPKGDTGTSTNYTEAQDGNTGTIIQLVV